MIVYYLTLILFSFLTGALSPLLLAADVALDPNVAAAIAQTSTYLWEIWTVIPVAISTLLGILVVIIGVETKIFSYKVVKWIYNKIPGVN